mmetsp:Transcript_86992/g.202518  ORF Transcript_86992/g.202518 Transcript_86992/m.202518 type:complete len:171 (+) Transcript_86992:70-582(+)
MTRASCSAAVLLVLAVSHHAAALPALSSEDSFSLVQYVTPSASASASGVAKQQDEGEQEALAEPNEKPEEQGFAPVNSTGDVVKSRGEADFKMVRQAPEGEEEDEEEEGDEEDEEQEEQEARLRMSSDQRFFRDMRQDTYMDGGSSVADRLKSQRHRRQKNINDPLERDD